MKLLSFDYKKLLKRLTPAITRYRFVTISLLILVICGFVILRVNKHASIEPNEERYQEELKLIKGVKFNEDAIKKIESLRNRDAEVHPDFPENRSNPFL